MMDETAHSHMTAALIALTQRGQVEEELFRASLSAEEREQVGTAEQWAPKEVIAHLGFWKRRQAARLRAVARGEEPPDFADFEALNSESWPEHSRLTWEESVARSDEATDDLIAALEALPATMFTGGEPSAETDQLASSTLGNGLGHIAAHMSDYYMSHGEMDRAVRTQRETVAAVISANLGDAQEGTARYNLACFHAQHGQADDALVELQRAFALRPDLIPWAREDHDLDNLRANPEFQTLMPPAPKEDA